MNDPCTAFRQAIEGRDVDAAVRLFSDDVRFFSPVVHKAYVGHEPLLKIVVDRSPWYAAPLAVGDWPMARRQLKNLAQLAEAEWTSGAR